MNLLLLTQFAVVEASEKSDIFTALGIDWQMLIFQLVAFVILVVLLGKFVYPVLIKAVDARQEEIGSSAKAAADAEKKADEAKHDVEKVLQQARREAADIVSTAKEEAVVAIKAAEVKAKVRSEHIVSDAHEEIEKDIAAAKKVLYDETLSLVALATEKVVGKTISSKVDEAVIAAAIKEIK